MGTSANNTLDMMELLHNNVNTQLTDTYQHKILVKIKDSFTEEEQRIVLSNFYCYLNHHQTLEFIVDLDDIWEWLGYSQKIRAKELLDKHFKLNTDYIFTSPTRNIARKAGRQNNTIMMNLYTFKRVCLRSNASKAKTMHEYYVKLEMLLFEVLQEESDGLKQQLQAKDAQIEIKDAQLQRNGIEKELVRESALLEQFGQNIQCVYIGLTDNVSDCGEPLAKFGNSNNLRVRVAQHKKTYTNFRLIGAFKVLNKTQIENMIKAHPQLELLRRKLVINNVNHTELLAVQPECQILRYVGEVIASAEISPKNHAKLLDEVANHTAVVDNYIRAAATSTATISTLICQVGTLKQEAANAARQNTYLTQLFRTNDQTAIARDKRITKLEQMLSDAGIEEEEEDEDAVAATAATIDNNIEIMDENIGTKRCRKDKDGMYCIDGVKYAVIRGTRKEVWAGVAYQTTGKVVKANLTIGKRGKIVSAAKSMYAKQHPRLNFPLPGSASIGDA